MTETAKQTDSSENEAVEDQGTQTLDFSSVDAEGDVKPLFCRLDVSDLSGATIRYGLESGSYLASGNLYLTVGEEAMLLLPGDLVPDPDPVVAASVDEEDYDSSIDSSQMNSEILDAKESEIAELQKSNDALRQQIDEAPMADDPQEQETRRGLEEQVAAMNDERGSFSAASEMLGSIYKETVRQMTVAKLEEMQKAEKLPMVEGKKENRVRQLETHYDDADLKGRVRLVARARQTANPAA